LIHGDSNKHRAQDGITEATVKVHVKTILRKIRVHNRTQAAVWAMSTGPFIAAKDDAAQQVEKLPVEPFPNLNGAQVLSARDNDGSTLCSTVKLKGRTMPHCRTSRVSPASVFAGTAIDLLTPMVTRRVRPVVLLQTALRRRANRRRAAEEDNRRIGG
jgi:hypothetical protein